MSNIEAYYDNKHNDYSNSHVSSCNIQSFAIVTFCSNDGEQLIINWSPGSELGNLKPILTVSIDSCNFFSKLCRAYISLLELSCPCTELLTNCLRLSLCFASLVLALQLSFISDSYIRSTYRCQVILRMPDSGFD